MSILQLAATLLKAAVGVDDYSDDIDGDATDGGDDGGDGGGDDGDYSDATVTMPHTDVAGNDHDVSAAHAGPVQFAGGCDCGCSPGTCGAGWACRWQYH